MLFLRLADMHHIWQTRYLLYVDVLEATRTDSD
jgi:hypothetical protein